MGNQKQNTVSIYKTNKLLKVGDSCICPICGTTFVKRQWQQAFCCGVCKDKYHNKKGDRHRAGYHQDYNLKHPERLERVGLTPYESDGYEYDHPFSSEALGQW